MMRSRLMALVTALVVIGSVVGGGWYLYSNSVEKRLGDARRALRDGDHETAQGLVDGLLESDPNSIVFHELAVRVADESNDEEEWLKYSVWLVDNSGDAAAGYARGIAMRALQTPNFDQAEEWLRRTLELDPSDTTATQQLAELYSNQGRRWEAYPLYTSLIKADRFDLATLIFAARTEDMLTLTREFITQRLADREQAGPLLGIARFGMATDGTKTSEVLLREVIKTRPDIVEARVRLAEYLFDKQPADCGKVLADVPAEATEFPSYWVMMGKWYRKKNKPRLAVSCFRQALQLDPNRYVATFQLGQLLLQLGQDEQLAADFRERATTLNKVGTKLVDFFDGRGTPEHFQEVSDMMLQLGRYREALAWAQYASTQGQSEWANARLRRLDAEVTSESPVVRNDFNLVLKLNEANWPLPTRDDLMSTLGGSSSSSDPQNLTPIQLTNVAAELGANFAYFNGAVPNSETHQMYEFTGGGVGVIDYDLDGAPEFFLPNGTTWPPKEGDKNSDALFRNTGSAFVSTTEAAGIREHSFGQGVAVGDVDGDGFPDLYVANTHRNQLWLNNGDGTFEDATDSAGLSSSVWTTSCVVADLNNDGLADIYDVNFLTGDDVFTRVCDEDGRPRSCPPAEFPGEQDRVHINNGDGTFRDVTEDAGIVRPRGNGLGIVAADFDGSRKLNLFLANDSVPNFYYANASTPETIAFEESALLAGLDVDHAGKSQACMGVGLADVDANGRPDLFITNFYNESNALYLQQDESLFSDECRSTNVRQISQKMLGFGTQFFDVDANGWPDLIITNGHVDDFTHNDKTPYQMRPQVLRHNGSTSPRFSDQVPEPTGAYFGGKHLGRGLARLDFNRDGLDDFGVSHLDSPFALVRNDTTERGTSISIRLVATSSERTAIGSIVRITAGDRTFTQQLSAGDGYMASNERRLTIGLGDIQENCEVEVEWMSGQKESFGSVGVNERFILVEGRGRSLAEPR